MAYLKWMKFAFFYNHGKYSFINGSISQKPILCPTMWPFRYTDTKHNPYCISFCALNLLLKLLNFDLISGDRATKQTCQAWVVAGYRKKTRGSAVFPLQISHVVNVFFGKTFSRIVRLFVAICGFCSSHEIHFIIFIQNSCGKQS